MELDAKITKVPLNLYGLCEAELAYHIMKITFPYMLKNEISAHFFFQIGSMHEVTDLRFFFIRVSLL